MIGLQPIEYEDMKIKLNNFEGPYDLLLELVQQEKLDLSEISLENVVDQFLFYIQDHSLPPSLYADFVVVASSLVLLKMRRLMPHLTEEETEELQELTDRVRLYQLYRRQALSWQRQWGWLTLLPASPRLVNDKKPMPHFEAKELLFAIRRVQARVRPSLQPIRHLRGRRRSLQACIDELANRLRQRKTVLFAEYVAQDSPNEIAIKMLAMLELVRQRSVQLEQDILFGDITISETS